MSAIVVVGTQFGDEGKGKIVDYFTENADLVVRYNGGSNAGHTVVIGTEKYKLRLMPSGVFYENKVVVIGNGVVVDPEILLTELLVLEKKLGRPVNLKLSDRAHVVMPYHKVIDELEEKLKGNLSAGTTKMGIGPCYSDKSSRFGIRICDLLNPVALKEKLDIVIPIKEKLFSSHGLNTPIIFEDIYNKYLDYGKKLSPYVTDTSIFINNVIDMKKNVLFEGAQGTFLDVDHGIYPYGTSSNPIAGGACTGTGVGPTRITSVVGIVKAYTSRVGEGPFPTELNDEICKHLREKGGEYGTATGRPRRCGWLDMVMLRYAIRINGINSLAVTKLDILGGLKVIKVAKEYKCKGKVILDFPSDIAMLKECVPVYDEFDGWDEYSKTQWQDLMKQGYSRFPENIVKYIGYLHRQTNTPIDIISFGQERELTLNIKHNK